MKLKAGQLFSIYELLVACIKDRRDQSVRLPAKGAYRIARLIAALEPEAQVLRLRRFELIKQNGEEIPEQKGTWRVLPTKLVSFSASWAEVTEEEISVSCEALPLSALGDESCYFSVAELLLLGPLVREVG